jgi:hypothetical protein
VIVAIDKHPVRNADHAVSLSRKAKGDHLLLRVWRGSEGGAGMLWLAVDNGKRE